MKRFLTLKHYQIFGIGIAFFALFSLEIIFIDTPIINFITELAMLLVFISLFVGWYYSAGTELFKLNLNHDILNLKKFKISIFILTVFSIFLLVSYVVNYFNYSENMPNNGNLFLLLILFDFTYIFCIAYCATFIAKNLKALELQKPVVFSEYIIDIFLIWFFILGIWYIQPRLNKLFDKS